MSQSKLQSANEPSAWTYDKTSELDSPALNTFIKKTTVEGYEVELVIWDHSGMDNYEQLRRLSYENVDVTLVCFDISEPDSLDNVQEKVLPHNNGSHQ